VKAWRRLRDKLTRQGAVTRFARTGFAVSTLAELAWQRTRHATRRWSGAGLVVGTLVALVAFAPAAWLARAVAAATEERLLLADARGTVWSGSAVPVFTGGPGSRDALTLPGRLEWSLLWRGLSFDLRARQDCCLDGELTLHIQPGLGRVQATLLPPAAPGGHVGQWPAGWLAGLGTPWNTLQLGGVLSLSSPGFSVEWVQGRTRFTGQATLDISHASSRVTTLDSLGSYRLLLRGDAQRGDASTLTLSTLEGALQLSGEGQWSGGRMHFSGEARAAPGREAALANLLNIIGRRQGARAVISIG
jgi:general secretion pathway protein N